MPNWYTEWHLFWIDLFQDPLLFWGSAAIVFVLTLALKRKRR